MGLPLALVPTGTLRHVAPTHRYDFNSDDAKLSPVFLALGLPSALKSICGLPLRFKGFAGSALRRAIRLNGPLPGHVLGCSTLHPSGALTIMVDIIGRTYVDIRRQKLLGLGVNRSFGLRILTGQSS